MPATKFVFLLILPFASFSRLLQYLKLQSEICVCATNNVSLSHRKKIAELLTKDYVQSEAILV